MKQLLILCAMLSLLACNKNSDIIDQVASVAEPKSVNSSPFSSTDDIPATAYVEHGEIYNPESVIPPQCYTKTDGVNNPCYACHQTYPRDEMRPNAMNDGSLQGEYQFSDLGTTNHWKNLFVDRRPLIQQISDQDIKDWINQDNYSAYIETLKSNKEWQGEVAEIKDLAFPEKAFDNLGIAKDGSHWVAYNYKPFPSTFWPTNGSTGDAMIRLPKAFRELDGEFSQELYFVNLALVEMALKDTQSTSVPAVSEQKLQIDINGDNRLDPKVTQVVRQDSYLGDANLIKLEKMLYPQGTEFLHTVRYIGVDDNGEIFNAPRMKEVRYMKKHMFKSKQNLASSYYIEAKDKNFEMYPTTIPQGDKGINNNFGWTINGYIEDEKGALRHQNIQELAFCNGCHKTVGATFDQTFSFPRKVEGLAGWGYFDLRNQQDVPNMGESQGEFLTYFQRVGGGDEFRQNQEMLEKWFNQDVAVNADKVAKVDSLYELITPSPRRALDLNKAYLTIVKEQSYLFGRDAIITKATNVLKKVDESQQPLAKENRFEWDLRLNWHKKPSTEVSMAEQK